MEIQGCPGQPDIVLGGLEQCFGAAVGFAAFRDPTLKTLVQSVHRQGSRPSLAAAATVLAALELVDSAEGEHRRRRLHAASLRLRNQLVADGLRVLGQPSGFVPVVLPPSTADARAALLASAGPVVPLLKAPVVAGHSPRWSIRLSADHGPADIDNLAELICEVGRVIDRLPRKARRAEALQQP
jgi:7-keto-8-aminopelargonate synthetase-like enzyme